MQVSVQRQLRESGAERGMLRLPCARPRSHSHVLLLAAGGSGLQRQALRQRRGSRQEGRPRCVTSPLSRTFESPGRGWTHNTSCGQDQLLGTLGDTLKLSNQRSRAWSRCQHLFPNENWTEHVGIIFSVNKVIVWTFDLYLRRCDLQNKTTILLCLQEDDLTKEVT